MHLLLARVCRATCTPYMAHGIPEHVQVKATPLLLECTVNCSAASCSTVLWQFSLLAARVAFGAAALLLMHLGNMALLEILKQLQDVCNTRLSLPRSS